jgi:hypothetical protein
VNFPMLRVSLGRRGRERVDQFEAQGYATMKAGACNLAAEFYDRCLRAREPSIVAWVGPKWTGVEVDLSTALRKRPLSYFEQVDWPALELSRLCRAFALEAGGDSVHVSFSHVRIPRVRTEAALALLPRLTEDVRAIVTLKALADQEDG